MTRVAPKIDRKSARAAKSENFLINEPGREPFYVHAFHEGNPAQCADLQASSCLNPPLLFVATAKSGGTTRFCWNGVIRTRWAGILKCIAARLRGGVAQLA